MTDTGRTPVLVGAGQLRSNRERQADAAREPLQLIAEAARLAAEDAGAPGLLSAVDAVHTVATASWHYESAAAAVARAVGATPRTCVDSVIGGHLPARMLDAAAAAVWAGDSDVVLLAGGEAQASLNALQKAGRDPVRDAGWSAEPGGAAPLDPAVLGSPQMLAAGLFLPARVYPLYENALQAALGLAPQDAALWSARLYSDLSRVAADHPAAWSPQRLTAQQVLEVTPSNRMVNEPYPLSMNAMPHVDQAAAVLVMSLDAARRHGVPLDRVTYVWGGAGADDEPDVLRRETFTAAPAMEAALRSALERAGVEPTGVDLVDVYSCFPVVPKLAGMALGLDRDAVLSVAGGHSSFGGPLNSYSLHAVATMVERLRRGASVALVHANGGYLTYQHAVVLAADPHPDGYVGQPEPQTLPVTGPKVLDALQYASRPEARLTVETLTVEHGRTGEPAQAFVVGRTDDGDRVAAATAPGDTAAAASLSLASLPAGAASHVGRRVGLSVAGDQAVVVP